MLARQLPKLRRPRINDAVFPIRTFIKDAPSSPNQRLIEMLKLSTLYVSREIVFLTDSAQGTLQADRDKRRVTAYRRAIKMIEKLDYPVETAAAVKTVCDRLLL